uniref:IQ calmodulin-binding motif containing protein n=1 Tax=Angomonas deanei TaxID=59799 RepID=C6K3K8_9TRYP|nr:conserved hypothetical protein [Angomonas deanei]
MRVGGQNVKGAAQASSSARQERQQRPANNSQKPRNLQSPPPLPFSSAKKGHTAKTESRNRTLEPLDEATLTDYTRWNEEAMEALRRGDSITSRQLLSALLPKLQQRLHAVEANGTSAQTDVVQSWRLVYALTLNNYGCQLRRDGDSDGALRQFNEAQAVESAVFGKPSCSTMLNLSAVLLSKGEAKQALKIATECAAAAQDGEPILFITALHNLAVALGQQTSERSRGAALPTMLQALREAQAALGEQHPTTRMLREKCGLSSQWIHSTSTEKSSSAAGPAVSPAPVADNIPQESTVTRRMSQPPPFSTSSPQDRARAALYTLNFGQPIAAPKVAPQIVLPQVSPSQGVLAFDAEEREAASPMSPGSPLDVPWGDDCTQRQPADASPLLPRLPSSAKEGSDSRVSRNASPLLEKLVRSVESTRRSGSNVSSGSSNAPVAVNRLCLDSAHLSMVDLGTPVDGLEAVLQEPFQASRINLQRHGATTLRDLCRMEPTSGGAYPSFLRFSAPHPRTAAGAAVAAPPAMATAPSFHTSFSPLQSLFAAGDGLQPANDASSTAGPASPNTSLTQQRNTFSGSGVDPTQPYNKSLSVSATAPTLSAKEATSHKKSQPISSASAMGSSAAKATSASGTVSGRRKLFGPQASRLTNRAAQRQEERAEEEAYRRKLKADEEAAEAARVFKEGLEAVKERTRNRAAAVIQRSWQQWWCAIGQPRRHVQLQRLEELQRRRRERLALSSATGKRATSAKPRTVTIPPPPSQQHGRVAGYVVPAVVVRCAKTWMAKTEGVRCVARVTGSPVDARLHEADIRQRVCRLQALWRGTRQRLHNATRRGHDSDEARSVAAEVEAREYAALVIQCSYRRFAARARRRELYEARHSPAATLIQRWLRRTWAAQRQRGVDGPTMRHRNAAALSVQRVWRGYQGRLAFRMAQLRQRIDQANPFALSIEERRSEEMAASIGNTSTPSGKPLTKDSTAASGAGEIVVAPSAASTTRAVVDEQRVPARAEAYSQECLHRSSDVQQVRDDERDAFHIPLYVETMAKKERTAWQESIRLRPTEVVRRRAELNAMAEAQQSHFTRNRAARVIQRGFRVWNAMRQDASRDTNLLRYARLRYQQQELGRAVARQQHGRDATRAKELYGDSTQSAHAEHEAAAAALAAETAVVPMDSAAFGRTFPLAGLPSKALQRRELEAAQRRDERLLALTQAHDAAHLREGPAECEARLGTTYEHPYYNPYANEEHRRTLGID